MEVAPSVPVAEPIEAESGGGAAAPKAKGDRPHVVPNKFHKTVVDNPCAIMGGCCCCIWLGLIIFMAANLTLTLTANAWYDQSHIVTRRQFAYQARMQDWTDAISGGNTQEDAERSQPLDQLMIIYEPQDGSSALAPKHLTKIREIEQELRSFEGVENVDDWCMLPTTVNSTDKCEPWLSVAEGTNFGALVDAAGAPLADADVTTTMDTYWCTADGGRTSIPIFYVDSGFDCDTNRKADHVRSVFTFGGPLSGYKNLKDDTMAQHMELANNLFIGGAFASKLYELQEQCNADGDLKMYYGGENPVGGVLYGIMLTYLNSELIWLMCAMFIVFYYLAWKLNSLFLAMCGFLEIILSVPLAFALYACMGFGYLSFLQYMGIFIIMGIGADDIFVFMDAWKQSGTMGYEDRHERFAFAYGRAASAMTVTSATSAMAFFATAFSPIPTVMCFGLTMGLMVIVDFLLVITWFPASVIVYERWFEQKACACCPPTNKCAVCCVPCCLTAQPAAKDELGAMEVWFSTTFSDFMADQKKRRGVLAFFAVLLIVVFSVDCALFEVTGDFPPNFVKNHWLHGENAIERFNELAFTKFSAGDGSMKLPTEIFFGIDLDDPVDREGLDPQADELGEPHADKAFDLTTHAAQLSVLTLCDTIKARTDLVFLDETWCFMRDFVDYLNMTGKNFFDGTNSALLAADPDDGTGFPTYLTMKTLSHWNTGQMYDTGMLIEGGVVTMAWVGFNTTLPLVPEEKTVAEYQKIMDKWSAVLDTHNKVNPATQAGQFCVYWFFVQAAAAIVDSSILGVTVSLTFAFLVLIVANRNYIVPFLAMMPILAIMCMVMFVIFMQDGATKTIDFMGSICLIVVIGLSVDYSVHLCHAYMESKASAREDRMRDSATEMGVSVVSGAITTFGASIFLLCARFTFFIEFGIFMACTVLFSIVFALALFMALVAEFGPERDADGTTKGDIKPLLIKAGIMKEDAAYKSARIAPNEGGQA